MSKEINPKSGPSDAEAAVASPNSPPTGAKPQGGSSEVSPTRTAAADADVAAKTSPAGGSPSPKDAAAKRRPDRPNRPARPEPAASPANLADGTGPKTPASAATSSASVPASASEPPGQGAGESGLGNKLETSIDVIRRLRRERARRLLMQLAIFVGIPTLISVVYFGILASDQFESTCTFVVRSATDANVGAPGTPATSGSIISSLKSGRGAATRSGAEFATDPNELLHRYVLSRDLMAKMEKETKLLRHYRQDNVDWFSRLGDGRENAFKYYLDKITLERDMSTGVSTIRLRAFAGGDSRRFVDAILKSSEDTLNDLAKKNAAEQVKLAESDAKRSMKLLKRALERRAQGELFPTQETAEAGQAGGSPDKTATSKPEGTTAAGATDSESADAADKAPTAPSADPSAPPSPTVAPPKPATVIATAAAKTPPSATTGRSQSMAAIDPAMRKIEQGLLDRGVDEAFAAYNAAQAHVWEARSETERKAYRIVRITNPSQPDEPTHPHRLRSILATLLFSTLGLGIVSLAVAAVREHTSA